MERNRELAAIDEVVTQAGKGRNRLLSHRSTLISSFALVGSVEREVGEFDGLVAGGAAAGPAAEDGLEQQDCWGKVRPVAGDLGSAAPGSENRGMR
jgi:hypothetical protein